MTTVTRRPARARWNLGHRRPAAVAVPTEAERAAAEAEALARVLAEQAALVAEDAVLVVDAAARGQLPRVVAALMALQARTDIALGALAPAAQGGAVVPEPTATAALAAALNTSLFTAALAAGMENPR